MKSKLKTKIFSPIPSKLKSSISLKKNSVDTQKRPLLPNYQNPTDIYSNKQNAAIKKKNVKKRGFLITYKMKKGTEKVVRTFLKKQREKWYKTKGKKRRVRTEKKMLNIGYLNKKIKKEINTIHIQSTHNNTIYTVASNPGKTTHCVSTGMCGFKNARKSTKYASQAAAEKVAALAKKRVPVNLKLKGLGSGKYSGVQTLNQFGLKISTIRECTVLPHNGCRPPRRRRL